MNINLVLESYVQMEFLCCYLKTCCCYVYFQKYLFCSVTMNIFATLAILLVTSNLLTVQGYDQLLFPIDGTGLSKQAQDCIKETSEFFDTKLSETTHSFILGSLDFSQHSSGTTTELASIPYNYDSKAVDAYQNACQETDGIFISNCWFIQPNMMFMKNIALCLASTDNCRYFFNELDVNQVGLECEQKELGEGNDSLLPEKKEIEESKKHDPNYDLPNYDFHEGLDQSNHLNEETPTQKTSGMQKSHLSRTKASVLMLVAFAGICTILGVFFFIAGKRRLRRDAAQTDIKVEALA